ncbi:hypothetical protein pEaSNUABM8_00124 [Erwinia phage pEa_SNUABM_8]|nr:hypothetical protein pEaSNUABM8_00124 [Erwinia phage pEa_SNUABM_8]QVW54876.1 hypothetical protein pEaSNUABM4_00123 [Erwinia phage pEa_SNUABM_4]
MKPIYYHGAYKTPVIIHGDNHCKHQHKGGWSQRTVTQIMNGKAETHHLCRNCNDALLQELYGTPVACGDCGKMMAKRDAIPWSSYGHNPADPQMHLCSDCIHEPTHFTRIERDRETFMAQFEAK